MHAKQGNLVDADASGAKASTKRPESSSVKVTISGSLKSRRGTAYYCIIMWALESDISKERSKHLRFREPHSAHCIGDPCEYSHLYVLKLESFTNIACVYRHSNFSGGKTFSPQECTLAVQGHPMSLILVSKVCMRLPISPS